MKEAELVDSEWECHAHHLAERRAVRRAQTLVVFQGWLVPIGEPDHAESLPREVIGLTDNSEEEHRGVLTFHAEVECARANPAPEYKAPPPGYDAPGLSRS